MPTTKKRKTKKKATKKTTKAARRKIQGQQVGEINGFPVVRFKAGALQGAAAPYNPRRITDAALEGLKTSVGRFGLVEPIAWNKRTGHVVGGHQRLKTLDPGAATEVVVVDLDQTEEKALNLALNNPHAAGEWTEALAQILDELEVEVPDLTTDLNLDELRLDVPMNLDDLTGVEAPGGSGGSGGGGGGEGGGLQANEVRQLVLTLSPGEYEEATQVLQSITESEELASEVEAFLYLIREHQG